MKPTIVKYFSLALNKELSTNIPVAFLNFYAEETLRIEDLVVIETEAEILRVKILTEDSDMDIALNKIDIMLARLRAQTIGKDKHDIYQKVRRKILGIRNLLFPMPNQAFENYKQQQLKQMAKVS